MFVTCRFELRCLWAENGHGNLTEKDHRPQSTSLPSQNGENSGASNLCQSRNETTKFYECCDTEFCAVYRYYFWIVIFQKCSHDWKFHYCIDKCPFAKGK